MRNSPQSENHVHHHLEVSELVDLFEHLKRFLYITVLLPATEDKPPVTLEPPQQAPVISASLSQRGGGGVRWNILSEEKLDCVGALAALHSRLEH